MRGLVFVALLPLICSASVTASDDGEDGVTRPVPLASSELPLPKAMKNARFRMKLLYSAQVKPDGSAELGELLLCTTRKAGESEFAKASKDVCDPVDKEVRVGLSKRRYQPALKDGKAVAFDMVVKVDLGPSEAE